MKDIGSILRNEIEKRGLQQNILAHKAGYSQPHFWQILQKEDMQCSMLEKCCKAIGLQPASFFDAPFDGEPVEIPSASLDNISIGNDDAKLLKKQLKDKQEIIESQRKTIASLEELLALYRDKNGTKQSQNAS